MTRSPLPARARLHSGASCGRLLSMGIRSYRGDCRDRERARVPVDCRDRPARSVHPCSRRVGHDSRPRRSRTERVSLAANPRGAPSARSGGRDRISHSRRFVAIDVRPPTCADNARGAESDDDAGPPRRAGSRDEPGPNPVRRGAVAIGRSSGRRRYDGRRHRTGATSMAVGRRTRSTAPLAQWRRSGSRGSAGRIARRRPRRPQ